MDDDDTIRSEPAPPFDVLLSKPSRAAVADIARRRDHESGWNAWEASWTDNALDEILKGADQTWDRVAV